jgi:hypothetical protein
VRTLKTAVPTRGEPNARPNPLVEPLLPAFSFSTAQPLSLGSQGSEHYDGTDEAELIQEFDVEGADASDLLGFDDEVDEDYHNSEEFEDIGLSGQSIDSSGLDPELLVSDSPRGFQAYQASIRVAAAKRAEGNRRSGGIKTQKGMVKAWKASRYFKWSICLSK